MTSLILSTVSGLMPWYGWALLVIAALTLTYLGLWPLVIGFLRGIPLPVYGALAVAALLWLGWVAVGAYGDQRFAAGVTQGIAQEHERAARAQERADAIANAVLADQQVKFAALRKQAQEKLEQQEKDARAELERLKGSLPAYVSPLRLSSFPALPRGFLRYGAAAAAFANGEGADPRGAAVQPDDEPSTVSLAAWGDYLADQASAFRSCTAWGSGWRDYAGRLKAQCESTISTLQGNQP
jgi:hypothetical protein